MSKGLPIQLVLLTGVLALGCKPEPEISTYTVPRSSPVEQPVDVDQIRAQLDHMLVAIVPHNEQAWFFKMVGPAEAIDRNRKAFEDFVSTVSFNQSTPNWQLPEGWSEQGASQMRFNTIVVSDDAEPLEIAVSSLPLNDPWEVFLARNVNRWLGQLSQSGLSKGKILELTQQIPTESEPATLIELAGKMSQQPTMGNPHAAMTDSPAPQASTAPIASSSGPLKFEVPDSWEQGQGSAMRKASFAVKQGELLADVSVMSFPDSPATQMGEVEPNVLRWARQVGLVELQSSELDRLVEPITIDGIEAHYVELYSPESEETAPAILAAMLVREGQVWFFKMSGHRGLVEEQTPAFREFLDSVRFSS